MAVLRRTVLSAIAIGALAVSLLTPLAAQASPAQSASATPVDVPVIQSDPLKVTTPSEPQGVADEPDQTTYAQPAGRVKTAESNASVFDTASETVSSMDEYSTTYVDKNGAHRTEVSPTPVHVRSNGAWVDASGDLSDDGKSGLVGKLNPLQPRFASNADASKLFSVARDGHTLSFALDGAKSSALQHPVVPLLNIGANAAGYASALSNVDLHYVLSAGEVKESMVLNTVPAAKHPVYSWTITAPGLAPVKDTFGDLEFIGVDGSTVFTMPVPTMWDSSGKDGQSQPAVTNVDYEVTPLGDDRYTLALKPDASWLKGDARVYPVILDPSVGPGADNIHSYKSDGTINNGQVWLGNSHQTSSCCNWRTITHYNYEQLFGQQIQGAGIGASYVSGTTTAYTGGVYWASAFSYAGAVGSGYLSSFPVGSSGSATDAGLGQAVANWVSSGYSGAYLGLLGAECSCYSYKALNTGMSISYVGYPSVTGVTGASPTGGARAPTMPVVQGVGSDPAGTGLIYQYAFTSSDGGQSWTSPWAEAGPYQVPQNNALTPAKHYSYTVAVRQKSEWFGQNTTRTASNAAWNFVTNNPAPTPPQAQVSPADGQVVTSLTPTFSAPQVVDADGDPVTYTFQIATGADNLTGAITTSGALTPSGSGPVTWTPPVGTLQDGGSYSLTVRTKDGIDNDVKVPWISKFTVNLRIGTSGPSPTDVAGPVTVNLANGNANLSFSSPTVATVGGPMGVSFSYNSLTPADKYKGLSASYYNALDPGQTSTTNFSFTGASGPRQALLTRTDPNISFDWGTGSPAQNIVPDDYFLAKWTGFITAPAANGPYTFSTDTDDGVRLYINGATLIDKWINSANSQSASAPTTLSGPVPFEMDYYENVSGAKAILYATDKNGNRFVVPSDWFTTTYLPLPIGWSASSPIAGASTRYASVQVTESAAIVTDVTGTTHTYLKASAGGYTAPAGEYGVLALDGNGLVTLTDADGVVTSFNAQGKVASTTSPSDAKKPATPIASYDPSTGRLAKLSDPVSSNGATPPVYSREVSLVYSNGPGTGNCPVLSGGDQPAAGLLCQIVYPGHTTAADTTQLFYNAASQLIRIVDPGGVQTDFGYDANGRLNQLRDPTTNQWLAAGLGTAASTNEVSIGYDGSGRVQSVTLPAPDGVTASTQPQKTYCYPDSGTCVGAANTTYVDQTGLDLTGSPIGHAEKVTYDTSMRALTVVSAMGVTTSQSWSDKDQLLASTDAAGHESTTLFDPVSDRATDSYGPAPASCFPAASMNANSSNTDRTPTGTCTGTGMPVAHSSTSYDQGLYGLNATYYDNQYLAGVPANFSLGLAPVTGATVATDGSVNANWNTQPIGPGLGADDTSLRLTGTITFPGPGTYKLDTNADDGTRIWLNDVNVLDNWASHSAALFTGQPFTIAAGDPLTRRIRVDYMELTSTASLQLEWEINGASPVIVPGSVLAPNYGLSTSSRTDDSAPAGYSSSQVPASAVTTGYGASPWLGVPTTTSVDPTGLNLTTTTAYETPGTGWLRKTSQTQPANVGTTSDPLRTTFAYWDDTAVSTADSAACVPAGVPQVGFLKTVTDPTPESGTAVSTSYVYDILGRVAGTKQAGDSGWSCIAYDPQGRVASHSYPAYGGYPARTVTNVYADPTSGSPLITSIGDASGTIVTTTDLLGRPVESLDALGSKTDTHYVDLTGRVDLVTLTPPTGAASTRGFTYDLDGKVLTEKVDGVVQATATYGTAAQLLQSVAYANGTSLSSIDYGPTGTTDGLTWAFPSGQDSYHDQVTRSQSGRILADTVTDGSTVSNSTYTFDAAGRLTQAVIPGHTLSYGFGTATCGAETAAGTDGNRTGFTDAHTVAGVTSTSSTSYCYDNADRLTGTTVTNAPAGANPVAGTGLSTFGPSPSLAYDAHGNTTSLADQSLEYDASNRNRKVTLTDGTKVEYTYDAEDRLIKRTATTPGSSSSSALAVDAQVSADSSGGWGSSVTSPPISTSGANELLVALVSSDGPQYGQTLTVSGGGLTWTQAVQSDQTRGDAEVWTAMASSTLSGVAVTAAELVGSQPMSLTVVAVQGASGVGATAGSSLPGAPTVSLTTTAVGSMVLAAGADVASSEARTPDAGQTVMHEDPAPGPSEDFWAQRLDATTTTVGSTATVGDSAPTWGGWNLAEAEIVPSGSTPVSIDTTSSVDAVAAPVTSAPITTTSTSETLLAFVSVDGWNDGGTVTGVTGGGLAWSLVERETGQPGDVEVWTAHASAPLNGVAVSAAMANEGGWHSLTVVALSGAGGVGAAVHTSDAGDAPTVSLTSTVAGSMVFGVGSDKDDSTPRTVAAGQTMIHEDRETDWHDEDYWVQRLSGVTGAAGSTVTIADTAPDGGDQWNLAAVEVVPASSLAVDAQVSADSEGGWGSSVTTGPISTSGANELLVALVAGDGPAKSQEVTVSGGGLAWTLAVRADQTNGDAEVWTAVASSVLSGVAVTSTESVGSQPQSLTVVAVVGAGGVGASVGSAWTGPATVSLTTTAVGSMVFGVGSQAYSSDAQTPGSGQTMLHEDRVLGAGADFWAQRVDATTAVAGSTATISDSAGSGWNLAAVEVVPSGSSPVSVDTQVSVDAVAAPIVSAPVTTSGGSETLLAFVSVDGWNDDGTVTGITGGGLTWSLVERDTSQPGDVEVWTAHASAPLSGVSVTAALTNEGGAHSLTVVALSGAAGVGAVAQDSGSGSAPAVSLTSTVAGSVVFGVGNDMLDPTPRVVGAGQSMVHEDSDTTWGEDFWVQRVSAPVAAAGSTVTVSDTAPDKWNLAAVEVTPSGTTTVPASTTVTEYAYSGASSAAWAELTSTGAVQQQEVSLPGGATYIARTAASSWSYGNFHGDTVILADGSGVRGAVASYDPFGNVIDSSTGIIGTTQADDAIPDTDPNADADRGWAGGAGKVDEHQGDIATILMGARQYVPLLGRFLSTDPVAGGNSNDYNYPNDPVDGSDLTGKTAIPAPVDWGAILGPGARAVGSVLGAAGALFGTGALLMSLSGSASKSVPQPNSAAKSAKKMQPYLVYVIYSAPTAFRVLTAKPDPAFDPIWKYGISGTAAPWLRPGSQISACQRATKMLCSWETVTYTSGWFQARTLEAELIQGYADVHGECPPGQRVSCM